MIRCLLMPLAVILAADAGVLSAAEPGVSLILTSASAERREHDILFRCAASLDNDTGNDFTVRTNFMSVFDGVELVVTTTAGKVLVQQPYVFHQAPFAPPGREITLKPGTTQADLVFPIRNLPGDAQVVRVRLVGTLPGSAYRRILSSDSKEILLKN